MRRRGGGLGSFGRGSGVLSRWVGRWVLGGEEGRVWGEGERGVGIGGWDQEGGGALLMLRLCPGV